RHGCRVVRLPPAGHARGDPELAADPDDPGRHRREGPAPGGLRLRDLAEPQEALRGVQDVTTGRPRLRRAQPRCLPGAPEYIKEFLRTRLNNPRIMRN